MRLSQTAGVSKFDDNDFENGDEMLLQQPSRPGTSGPILLQSSTNNKNNGGFRASRLFASGKRRNSRFAGQRHRKLRSQRRTKTQTTCKKFVVIQEKDEGLLAMFVCSHRLLHSLAPLHYARFARSLRSRSHSLCSLPCGTVEILEYVFTL